MDAANVANFAEWTFEVGTQHDAKEEHGEEKSAHQR
jgi:hypothetical protein